MAEKMFVVSSTSFSLHKKGVNRDILNIQFYALKYSDFYADSVNMLYLEFEIGKFIYFFLFKVK